MSQTSLCQATLRSTNAQSRVNTNATAKMVLDRDDDRVSIVFCPAAADYWAYTTNEAALNVGILVKAATLPPVMLSLHTVGGLVRSAWWITSPGGTQIVTILESLSRGDG